MNFRQCMAAAPATPACFPDRDQWVAYLLSCHESAKRRAEKPFHEGAYKPSFNFCVDCNAGHRLMMRASLRCDPAQFHGIPVVKA